MGVVGGEVAAGVASASSGQPWAAQHAGRRGARPAPRADVAAAPAVARVGGEVAAGARAVGPGPRRRDPRSCCWRRWCRGADAGRTCRSCCCRCWWVRQAPEQLVLPPHDTGLPRPDEHTWPSGAHTAPHAPQLALSVARSRVFEHAVEAVGHETPHAPVLQRLPAGQARPQNATGGVGSGGRRQTPEQLVVPATQETTHRPLAHLAEGQAQAAGAAVVVVGREVAAGARSCAGEARDGEVTQRAGVFRLAAQAIPAYPAVEPVGSGGRRADARSSVEPGVATDTIAVCCRDTLAGRWRRGRRRRSWRYSS